MVSVGIPAHRPIRALHGLRHDSGAVLFLRSRRAPDQRPASLESRGHFIPALPALRSYVCVVGSLHRRCAPLFLRDDQRFVWGQDLKKDLVEIDEHFKGLSESELERGIMAFAKAPPETSTSLTRGLRRDFLRPGIDDETPDPPPRDTETTRKLIEDVKKWEKAPGADFSELPDDNEDLQAMTFQRMVPKKKGSWWVLPKDLEYRDDDD